MTRALITVAVEEVELSGGMAWQVEQQSGIAFRIFQGDPAIKKTEVVRTPWTDGDIIELTSVARSVVAVRDKGVWQPTNSERTFSDLTAHSYIESGSWRLVRRQADSA